MLALTHEAASEPTTKERTHKLSLLQVMLELQIKELQIKELQRLIDLDLA